MAVAQLLLSMEPKYICHNQCTMDTSSPIVPKLSTEILLIPAILELYHIPPLKSISFERKIHAYPDSKGNVLGVRASLEYTI